MRNNNMKTAEEKEQIIKRFLNGESAVKIARENNIDRNRIYKWLKKYEKDFPFIRNSIIILGICMKKTKDEK